MNLNKKFDYSLTDSQGTKTEPMAAKNFDFDKYLEYETALLEKCSKFCSEDAGVAVHRRFRASEVFSYACKDMRLSLELQLGALNQSMDYKMDIPNFLEPWYGIGVIASAFGADYKWIKDQAPVNEPVFRSIEQALAYNWVPVEKTDIGKHTLEMIEFFLDETKGKMPISFTDIQSPLNIAASLVDINQFFMEFYLNPEKLKEFLKLITGLLIDFTKKQQELIGDNLASPGHGFASSRKFSGLGMSDDMIIMVSNQTYEDFLIPNINVIGQEFKGIAFHSCGNWSKKIPVVKKMNALVMVDGAFSIETDPDPNDAQIFREEFSKTGVVVNARIVGNAEIVSEQVRKLWKPDMKLIVVTYCDSPQDQEKAYNYIHEICN